MLFKRSIIRVYYTHIEVNYIVCVCAKVNYFVCVCVYDDELISESGHTNLLLHVIITYLYVGRLNRECF